MGTDAERALRGMLRTGTVASVNVANNTARVKFDDKDGIASPELQVSFIRASSYGNSTQSSGQLQVSGLERLDIKGKKVLLVDDILDTGITLSKVCKTLEAYAPAEIRTCVLLDKSERRTVDFNADFVGFCIENKFVVGYGLDYAENYRTYPEIWTLEEDYG